MYTYCLSTNTYNDYFAQMQVKAHILNESIWQETQTTASLLYLFWKGVSVTGILQKFTF